MESLTEAVPRAHHFVPHPAAASDLAGEGARATHPAFEELFHSA
jgi:hypothetical protein